MALVIFMVVYGVEELAADAAVVSFGAGLLIGSLGVTLRPIAFRDFRGDELVVDRMRLFEGDNGRGFGAGGERVATTTVSEGHDVAFAAGFDGGVVFLVGVSLAEIEGGGLDGGGIHVVIGSWLFVIGGEGENEGAAMESSFGDWNMAAREWFGSVFGAGDVGPEFPGTFVDAFERHVDGLSRAVDGGGVAAEVSQFFATDLDENGHLTIFQIGGEFSGDVNFVVISSFLVEALSGPTGIITVVRGDREPVDAVGVDLRMGGGRGL